MTTKVLLIDDSATARLALRAALADAVDLAVVGEAGTREEALQQLEVLQPEVIALDLYLRHESGLDVAKAIMRERPTPIVLVTGAFGGEPELLFKALAVGALEVLPKPPSPRHPDYDRVRTRLARTLRSLSAVPVVHQHRVTARAVGPGRSPPVTGRVVLVGASTGGPPTLAALLCALPPPLAFPWVVVQHIAASFTAGFARWITAETGHPARVIQRATPLQPGWVHLPPEGRHMVFIDAMTVAPDDGPARAFQKPSIDRLFESAAIHVGARALAVVLTGMGADGADGLLALRRRGAFTAVERPDLCVIDSMPRRALERGGASLALDLNEIAQRLAN